MQAWITKEIICGDFNNGNFLLTVVVPPELQDNIDIETQHIQPDYTSLDHFKKAVLPIICSNEGRLVKCSHIDNNNNKTDYLNGSVYIY